MDIVRIVDEFSGNRDVYKMLFSGLTREEYLWRHEPGKWCLLEVACHLYDEEREDFRARIKSVMEDPNKPLKSIDPPGWVAQRNYIEQDFNNTVERFLMEREWSIEWLRNLKNPSWENAHDHPVFGKMTAKMFLSNWMAHDYLHLRQILGLKFNYHKHLTGDSLTYAGEW